MLGIFKKQTGTTVKLLVEYELDYSEIIDKNNVTDIVDFKDILGDYNNITGLREIGFKAIKK
tara:strand:- start:1310 stop:1495 length:186 start_codon:yes stop_codon:yes gene_type:complete